MPSSVIADSDYDEKFALLTVTFVSGRIYQYLDVELCVAVALEEAPSKGAYFNRHIRDRYAFRKLTQRSG
jgi:KTSC domain